MDSGRCSSEEYLAYNAALIWPRFMLWFIMPPLENPTIDGAVSTAMKDR